MTHETGYLKISHEASQDMLENRNKRWKQMWRNKRKAKKKTLTRKIIRNLEIRSHRDNVCVKKL